MSNVNFHNLDDDAIVRVDDAAQYIGETRSGLRLLVASGDLALIHISDRKKGVRVGDLREHNRQLRAKGHKDYTHQNLKFQPVAK